MSDCYSQLCHILIVNPHVTLACVCACDGFHVRWRMRRSRARSERRKTRMWRRRKHLVCQTWHRKREGKRKKMCSYNVTAFKRLKTVI